MALFDHAVVIPADQRTVYAQRARVRDAERLEQRPDAVEAVEEGWLWGSPMPDGNFAVIGCVDASSTADASRYFAMVRASELFRALRGNPPVHCHDATTCASDVVCNERILRMGDASHSLDPLSSSGIRSAMQSALHASTVIHTILCRPEHATLARRFYEETQRAAVDEHTRWTRSFYAESRRSGSPFWKARAGSPRLTDESSPPREEVKLGDGIAIDYVPCIVGDFVEARRGVIGTARPFVWIGGAEAASLLRPLENRPMSAADLVGSWRGLAPPGRERAIFDELVRSGVITALRHE